MKLLTAVGLLAILVGVYLSLPPPEMSTRLKEWKAKGKYFRYSGHQVFFRDWPGQKKDGSVLLLLHGFPTCSYDWIKVMPALEKEFGRIILFDNLGFGFSDKPWDHTYSIMEQASVAEALLQSLAITKTHILAHDYGDTVAQELLARFNDNSGLQLLSVTLLNGGIFPETNFPRITQKALLIPYLGAVLARISNYYIFKKGLSDVFGKETQPSPDDVTDWWAAMRYNDGGNILHKTLRYIEERRENRDRWVSALQRATVPVSVVYGPADPVNPPGFVDYYKKTIPHPRIDVLGAHIGHYPQWEDPDATMLYYLKFLKSIRNKK